MLQKLGLKLYMENPLKLQALMKEIPLTTQQMVNMNDLFKILRREHYFQSGFDLPEKFYKTTNKGHRIMNRLARMCKEEAELNKTTVFQTVIAVFTW